VSSGKKDYDLRGENRTAVVESTDGDESRSSDGQSHAKAKGGGWWGGKAKGKSDVPAVPNRQRARAVERAEGGR